MSRVFSIVHGLVLSVALTGCVDPAAQNGASQWDAAVPTNDVDGVSNSLQATAQDSVSGDTVPGTESPEPIIPDIAPVDNDEHWETPKTLVQDTAPDDSGQVYESPEAVASDVVVADSGEQSETSEAVVQDNTRAVSGEPPISPKLTAQDPVSTARQSTTAASAPILTTAPSEPDKPAIDDDPERLMGLGAGDLTRMLGSPRFVRRDASAQLWRYRNSSCILDLFLYRNAGRPEYFVSHIEARRSQGGAARKRECFGALLLDRHDREAG